MSTALATRERFATITRSGRRAKVVSLVGYRTDAYIEHLYTHLSETKPEKRWCSIECLARTFYGSAVASNIRKVRQGGKVNVAMHRLMADGRFLLIKKEPDGYRRIVAVKLADQPLSEEDLDCARAQISEMARKSTRAAAMMQKALDLTNADEVES